ncbi:MAG TPA: Uma2 family endonuclease [Methylomirabilota bacterium]|nr:Uma2 family endonuclease [Methylomirabilota bacterium]
MSVTTLMTAEDLLAMPEVPGKRFELVRGELIEMPGVTALHGDIAGEIYDLLKAFARLHRLGRVYTDGVGYIVARDPDIVRVPDVSFVASERVPVEGSPDTFWPFAPDLAVEVVSTGDPRQKVYAKVQDYLPGGSHMVWVVWPSTRTVTAHAADGSVRRYGPDDELDGGDELPGFRVRVADLFEIVW